MTFTADFYIFSRLRIKVIVLNFFAIVVPQAHKYENHDTCGFEIMSVLSIAASRVSLVPYRLHLLNQLRVFAQGVKIETTFFAQKA